MKTKQNTKTKTVILSSIILGLSAISSYARPNSNHSSHQHRVQPTRTVVPQKAHGHQHAGYINRLPSNRRTVTFGNILYYIVGDIFYTHSNRGYRAVAKPRGYNSHSRYTPPRGSQKNNYHSNQHRSHYSNRR
ncbi:MAG: hypothetical protein ACSHX6_00970 [Akkermansiaceae bacterium]